MKQIQSIDRFLSKIFRGLAYGAGGVTCIMMIIPVLNAIARALFNSPVYGTIEIVSYGALLTGALALSQNEMDDGNATMTLVMDGMKPKARAVFLFLSQVLCSVFYGFVTYRYFREISNATLNRQFTSTLEIPMSIFNAMMFIGFTFLTLASLLKAVRNLLIVMGKFPGGAPEQDKKLEGEAKEQ